MNLNTVTSVRRPTSMDEIGPWRAGNAWLAGGTWLFSEPQPAVDTLIDLDGSRLAAAAAHPRPASRSPPPAGSPSSTGSPDPASWTAAPLFRECCDSFLASFKIWNAATVGGNICMSLPAGPMISLTAALEGVCTLWPRDGDAARGAGRRFRHRQPRQRAARRRIAAQHPPARHRAFASASPLRHASLTKLGRSAALLIGTQRRGGDDSCSRSPRPRRARCSCASTRCRPPANCGRRSTSTSPQTATSTTCTARAAYKRHLTYYFAEQIRAELAQPEAAA